MNNLDDILWKVRVDHVEGDRILSLHRLDHFSDAFPLKRRPTAQHGVDHATQRVEIGACRNAGVGGLFGRHVVGRPHDGAGGGLVVAKDLGDAEVDQLDGIVGLKDQVGRLQISVNDSDVMSVFERRADLDRDVQRPHPTQLFFAANHRLQCLAADQFHRVEELAMFFAVADQANDIRVL